MTKVNLINIFDPSLLPGTIQPQIQPLTDFLNQHVTGVVQVVRNGVTLGDNMKGSIINVTAVNDTWTNVALPSNLSLVGVIPLAVNGDIYSGFGYKFNVGGTLQIKFLFQTQFKPDGTTPSSYPVTVFAFAQ